MTGMAIERDFRKLAPATQAELRRVAVAMVRAGKTRIEAAEADLAEKGRTDAGLRALRERAPGCRGEQPGRPRKAPTAFRVCFACDLHRAPRSSVVNRQRGLPLHKSFKGAIPPSDHQEFNECQFNKL